MTVQVLLADDHPIVREGLKAVLGRQGFKVVGDASDGRAAVRLAQKLRPHVVILDLVMPGLNGLDAAIEIQKTCPSTNAILLTMHDEDQYVLQALRAGIRGYILKTQAPEDLAHAVREVSRGKLYLGPGVWQTLAQASLAKTVVPRNPLTRRERQVLQLIAEGETTKEIAVSLGIAPKTAERHRSRLMEKLGIHATAGLVRYAIREGLIQP